MHLVDACVVVNVKASTSNDSKITVSHRSCDADARTAHS